MDSSIIRSKKYPEFSQVSTCDFFYPLIEHPYHMGRIAAANVLSDMYAMGVVDIDNILMILSVSNQMETSMQTTVTKMIMKGFEDQCKVAETIVSGGQTVVNPWPIIGGTAMSMCKDEDIMLPIHAVPGDVLVLTKPLGIQVAVNCKQWHSSNPAKWELASKFIDVETMTQAYHTAIKSMTHLNRNAAKMMQKYKQHVHACTDVTGFGIYGHADNLCWNQTKDVDFHIHTLPIIKGMTKVNNEFQNYKLLKGLAAETSGGLLIAMSKEIADEFIKSLEEIDGRPAWIIGEVTEGSHKVHLDENTVKVIEI